MNIYELKTGKWMLSWLELGWVYLFVFLVSFIASLETNKIWDNTDGNSSTYCHLHALYQVFLKWNSYSESTPSESRQKLFQQIVLL